MFENETVIQMISHHAVPPPHPCRAGRPLLAVRWWRRKSAPVENGNGDDDGGSCHGNRVAVRMLMEMTSAVAWWLRTR